MGAGKSTIGRLLSKELNLPFKDADREIEERCGADIPWIFDVEGEEGFRRREANIIDELTQLPRVVLATGGGAVLSETNRKHLRGRGTVIYLETTVEQQYQRTRRDKSRPLIQKDDPKEILKNLLEEREPLYKEITDLTVPTHQGNPKAVVRAVCEYLEERTL